jgi:hypothetical protein
MRVRMRQIWARWSIFMEFHTQPQHRKTELDTADGVPLKIRKLLQEITRENDMHEFGVMTTTKNHCWHFVKFDTDMNNKHA